MQSPCPHSTDDFPRPGCRTTACSLQAVGMLFPLPRILFYLLDPSPHSPVSIASNSLTSKLRYSFLQEFPLTIQVRGPPPGSPSPLAFPDSSIHHTVISLPDFLSPTPDSEFGGNRDSVSVLLTTEFPTLGRSPTRGRCLINVCYPPPHTHK